MPPCGGGPGAKPVEDDGGAGGAEVPCRASGRQAGGGGGRARAALHGAGDDVQQSASPLAGCPARVGETCVGVGTDWRATWTRQSVTQRKGKGDDKSK